MKNTIKEKISVKNFLSPNSGREVANQFIIVISTSKGTRRYFQSYNSIIAVVDEQGNTTLDPHYWDYSVTTGRYRNVFLREGIAATREKIAKGIYKLANLN